MNQKKTIREILNEKNIDKEIKNNKKFSVMVVLTVIFVMFNFTYLFLNVVMEIKKIDIQHRKVITVFVPATVNTDGDLISAHEEYIAINNAKW